MDGRILDLILERKERIDRKKSLDPSVVGKLRRDLIIEMTYNSNSIEGNALSFSETGMVLEQGITIGGKTMREHLEVTHHEAAMEYILDRVYKRKNELVDILHLHSIILDRIGPDNAGRLRTGRIFISGTTHIPPEPSAVPSLMEEFMIGMDRKGAIPVEEAAMMHMSFIDIHPFVDGNGRCARLLLNLLLMRNGYPPILIKKVDRRRYIDTIVASRSRNVHGPFVDYIGRCMVQALDRWLDAFSSDPRDLITLKEAARTTPYSAEYLSLLARKGRIPATKVGRTWMISTTDMERYVAEMRRKHGKTA